MRTIIFGATGMLGQGVLDVCLRADEVTEVLTIGRTPTGRAHPKLDEIQHGDFTDFADLGDRLAGYDACFYCLGTSAAGKSEADYRIVSYDYPLAAAHALLAASPGLVFCYVSGAGTDPTGNSRMMWARVKGETENALLALSPRAYLFRPGLITPMPGTTSKTTWYRLLYQALAPLNPLLRRLAPRHITSSVRLGHAMIQTVHTKPTERVLTTSAINEAAAARTAAP